MSSACNTAFTCFLTLNALAWTKIQTQVSAAAQSLWLTSGAQSLWLTASTKSADLWLTASTKSADLWLSGAAKAQDLWFNGTQDFWLNTVEPHLLAIDAQWLALSPANRVLINAVSMGLILGILMSMMINIVLEKKEDQVIGLSSPLLMDVVKPLFPPSPALRRSTRPTVAPERWAPPTQVKAPAKRSPVAKQQTKAKGKPKGLTSMYLYHDIQTINGLDTRKGYYDQGSGYIQDTSTKAWTTLNAFALNHFKTLSAAGLTTRKSYKCSIGTSLYALNRGHKKDLSTFC